MRFRPKSLYLRLVLILAIGMFAAQILTGSIWFEIHDNRMLEIPARLFASRIADMVRLLDQTPDQTERVHLARLLQDDRFALRFIAAPSRPRPDASLTIAQQSIQALLVGVVDRRLARHVPIRLLHVALHGDVGARHGIWALFDSRAPSGDFTVQAALSDGTWLQVHALEGQAGRQTAPREWLFDYLTRIYLVRLAAVFLFALLAVRLAIGPLRTFAAAAERIGRNMYHPPLAIRGPTEVRRAAESLNAMQQQLIASVGERTRMLGMISHDLRTPITKLRLRAEMLHDENDRERFRADLIEMEGMLHNAIDFVQGVDVSEPLRDVDMQSLIDGLAEDFRELGHDVVVQGRVTRLIPGYARNLRRCLQNVLENATRFGRHVVIDVEDAASALRITVSDDGPGVTEPARLAAIIGDRPYDGAVGRFGMASPLDNERHEGVSHAGLGLHIVRAVAAAHGGTLHVANRLGSDKASLDANTNSVEADTDHAANLHLAAPILGFEALLVFPRN